MKTEKQILRKLKPIHKRMDEISKQLQMPELKQEYDRLIMESITINWVLDSKGKCKCGACR